MYVYKRTKKAADNFTATVNLIGTVGEDLISSMQNK